MIDPMAAMKPGYALGLAGFLLPVLAVFAPLAAAPLLAVAAVAALALGGYRALPRLETMRSPLTLVALLGVWGTLSASWSILPLHSFLEGLRFLAIAAAGFALIATALTLEESERDFVRRALAAGFILALVLLGAAALTLYLASPLPEEGVFWRWLSQYIRFDRSAVTAALVLWPVLLGLGGKRARIAAAILVPLAAAAVFALWSQAAMLCLIVGVAAWPFAWYLPRLTASLIGAVLIAMVTILPTAPLDVGTIARLEHGAPWLKPSAFHRLAIWHFAQDRIAERPILGWGLDAAREIPGGSAAIDDPRLPELTRRGALWMPLHPHNASLQWRLELGLPGAAIATLLGLWLLLRLGAPVRRQRANQAAALALTAAVLVVAELSYGFWQAWWQSTLWILAALMIALAHRPSSDDAEP